MAENEGDHRRTGLEPVQEQVREPNSIPWRTLGLILLLALGLRVVSAWRSDVIGADSYRFLAAADSFSDGDWRGAVHDSYHPLTALLIAGVDTVQHRVLPATADFSIDQRRRERAGFFVSIVAGLLVVWLAIDLTARLFPGVSPAAVGILAAVQPYFVRASADIMSDALHLACFGWALRSGVIALSGTRWGPFGVTGVGVGLAYLTRPEGLLLLPAIGGMWLMVRPWPWRVLISRCAFAAATVALLIVPYAASIGWRLTAKKSVTEFLGIESGLPPGAVPGGGVVLGAVDLPLTLASAGAIITTWFTTATELIGVLVLVGFTVRVRSKSHRDTGLFLYGAIAAGLCALLIRLLIHVEDPSYLSRRHVFLLVFMSLPFAVAGLQALSGPVASVLPPRLRTSSFALVLALVAAVLVPKATAAHRADQRAQRIAAEYILEHGGPGQRIYTDREKIAYYAGGQLLPLGPGGLEEPFRNLAAEHRAWLVFYRERLGPSTEEIDGRLGALGVALTPHGRWDERASRRPRHLELYLYERSD